MKELFSIHKLSIIFRVFGLVLAVLWITAGFFKTLLILIMAIIGIAISFYLKQTKILDHYFKSQEKTSMSSNSKNNNNNKMDNQKPVSTHPNPTTSSQSNGVNNKKNKTAPVSARPDPVVPNIQQGVKEKKHDAEKHMPHHPGSPESKISKQRDVIDPSKPLEGQGHPSDRARAQKKLGSEHLNGREKSDS